MAEDRISLLPDDLLLKILLLVPTKDAVSTTFLSKRWRFVWTMLPKLEYRETDNRDVKSKSVYWFLEETMRFHKAPIIQRLCVELGPQCPLHVDPVNWVAKALDSRVRKLIFKLVWRREPVRMPKSLYVCKTLQRLTLCSTILVDVPRKVSLPSLTELDLISVMYKDDDSPVRLLSGCPVLNRLTVVRLSRQDDNVRKFSVNVPSLLSLEYYDYTISQEEEEDYYTLVIDTPNLMYLQIFDTLDHSCSVGYMPHLTTAVISVAFVPNESFLRSLSSVKYLAIYPVRTMVTMSLWCDAVTNYSRLVECILSLSDQDLCESLVVFLSNCSNLKAFMVDTQLATNQSANHGPFIWNKPSSVPRCLTSHLEIFEWDGYDGREDEKELIRYVLGNSKCLKTARIAPKPTCSSEEKQKMIEALETMDRVSTSVLLSSVLMLFGDVWSVKMMTSNYFI